MTPKVERFESNRLVFEPRIESHAAEVFKPLCEKDLYLFINRNPPESKEWLGANFKRLESRTSPDGKDFWLGWVAKDKKTQEVVGIFELTVEGTEAFVAYTVFKNFWNQGFAVEGVSAMIDYAALSYKLERFIIEMDTRNRISVKVAEKLGFEFVKLTNNVGFVKEFVSHEFKFQKINTQ